MIGVLILSCTGCVTGTIYGKPLDSLESVDESRGLTYMGEIMDAMVSGTVDDINQLGYHYGQEDAETFEEFWADWEAFKPVYGQIESFYLEESYQFGNEMVFVFATTMEKGEMRISAMFTDRFELVMLFIYETGEAALAKTTIPEGVAEEEITLGEADDYPVSGKITYPENIQEGEKLPAVVLVSGDGANVMDMKAGNTYLYRDLAWGLAQQGIVSIRFDKRLYTYDEEMRMENAPARMSTVAWEYLDDALLATQMLREQPYVDAEKVYYVGHSQGGVVAPRVDDLGGDYAGFVLLSTSPRPWYDVIYDQYINYGLVDNSSEQIYYLVSKVKAEREFLAEEEYKDMDEEKQLEQIIYTRPAYYWNDYFSYDYVGRLEELAKPTLLLHGETDYQLKADVDFAAWQQELADKPWAELKSYEGLNHRFIESRGCFAGHNKEYDMPGRASEQVIEDIGSWILKEAASK